MTVQPGEQYAAVTIAGADYSADTLAQVEIKHGHEAFGWASAGMSTAQFTIRQYAGDAADTTIRVGAAVTITTGGTRRHTGHITDVEWQWEKTAEGWLLLAQIQTVGNLAALGSRLPTATSWPEQSTRARAQTIMAQCWNRPGESFTVQTGNFAPILNPIDERDPTTPALAELETITSAGEAFLFDLPTGAVIWQELSHRKVGDPLPLPADAVEYAPGFEQHLDIVNRMTLAYGPLGGADRPTVTSEHPRSQTDYGIWAESAATDYLNYPDAVVKADRIIRRQARPAALLPACHVLLNRLDPATFTAVHALTVGSRVQLPRLPDPYPITGPGQSSGVWIVEGWTENVGSRQFPDDEWKLTLHLSPPSWSLTGDTWADVEPSGDTWADAQATGLTWTEALTGT